MAGAGNPLRHLVTGMSALGERRRSTPGNADQRVSGRALQAARLKHWKRVGGLCEGCGTVVDLHARHGGFELDHRVRIEDGGPDDDGNRQVLCVFYLDGRKAGCHETKTRAEARQQGQTVEPARHGTSVTPPTSALTAELAAYRKRARR